MKPMSFIQFSSLISVPPYLYPNRQQLHSLVGLAFLPSQLCLCVTVLWKIEGKERNTEEAAKLECSPLCFEIHKLYTNRNQSTPLFLTLRNCPYNQDFVFFLQFVRTRTASKLQFASWNPFFLLVLRGKRKREKNFTFFLWVEEDWVEL